MESAIRAFKYEDLVGVRICPTQPISRSFHIAFLLDTSGSMQDERISTVKRTLKLFIDEMREGDCATLISYSSDANLLCVRESDPVKLHAATDALEAEGGTNMEAALCKLAEVPHLADIDAVFFLTDGEVNQGICSVDGLRSIAVNVAFRSHKIPIYTLGYGETHNAKLLQGIALATRSSYTYAETSEMIPSIVGTILAAMREEVAKGVELEWRGAECWEQGAEGTKYCVGSVVANKPQWVILKGVAEDVRVRWIGCEADQQVEIGEENTEVLEHWFRVKSVKAFSEIVNVLGIPRLQQLDEEIAASPVALRPLVLRIRAEIAEQIAYWETMPTMTNRLNPGYVTRMTSHVTAFANQRDHDFFASPTQRQVSGAMVHHFTQLSSCSSQDPANVDVYSHPPPLPLQRQTAVSCFPDPLESSDSQPSDSQP